MSYAVTMSSRVRLGFMDEEIKSTISLNLMNGRNLNMHMHNYFVSFEKSRFLHILMFLKKPNYNLNLAQRGNENKNHISITKFLIVVSIHEKSV
jgi:hypothetical protein